MSKISCQDPFNLLNNIRWKLVRPEETFPLFLILQYLYMLHLKINIIYSEPNNKKEVSFLVFFLCDIDDIFM
jgi:hypothetical protein